VFAGYDRKISSLPSQPTFNNSVEAPFIYRVQLSYIRGMPIDEICDAVERSNHLKKIARIVEGTRTRVEPDQAELLLKSGELILCIVGLYHLIKGWKGPSSPINFSDVRLVLPA
jgi:hypothetical protein